MDRVFGHDHDSRKKRAMSISERIFKKRGTTPSQGKAGRGLGLESVQPQCYHTDRVETVCTDVWENRTKTP